MAISIGQYLIRRLKDYGIDHIFCVPGDYILRFHKLIEEDGTLQYINATKEDSAGFMADAYARMRGMGAASVTYGVGLSIANPIAQAYVENSAVVLIAGAADQNLYAKNRYLHHLINHDIGELDETQLQIFKHLTIDQAVLGNPKTAAEEIDRCLHHCFTYQKPVYIEIPVNCVDLELKVEKVKPQAQLASDPAQLAKFKKELREKLSSSTRPLLWIGHQVQRFNLCSSVQNFAEKNEVPIVSNLLGKAAIDEHHPLHLGVYKGDMSREEVRTDVETSDCLIAIGLRLSEIDLGLHTARLNQQTKILISQEKTEINGQVYPSLTIQDAVQVLEEMPSLQSKGKNVRKPVQPPFRPNKSAKTTVSRFFECLQSHLTQDAFVITDVGDCLFGSIDLVLKEGNYLSCADWAGMGFAVPGALGAQIGMPTKRAVAIVGDGGFQMTGVELSTALKYGIDPIVFLLNNRGYGTERIIIEGKYNDIQNWNYAAITEFLGGGVGLKVSTEEELEAAMKTAFSHRGQFYLIELLLAQDDFSAPRERFRKAKRFT